MKYGGNAMPGAGPDPVLAEVAKLRAEGARVVLVHGGGPDIDRSLEARGIATLRIDGLRVTGEATLEVTEAALCGTVNKRIVRALLGLGANAVGVSGEDGAMLVSERARSSHGDLGFVGDVPSVNPGLVNSLLDAGYLPVVAPLAVAPNSAHALNVNADLAAAALAGALQASAFIAVTNVRRILRDLNDPASGIDTMTLDEARAFLDSRACRDGMKPKVQAAIAAVERGAGAAYICDARPGAIAGALGGDATILRHCELSTLSP